MKGSIQKYKTKQGVRYRYTVDVNQDGVRKQKKKSGFLRKKDAEEDLRKLLIEVDKGAYIEPSKETFASYIDYWFKAHYIKRIKASTQSSRNYLLEKHLIRENPFAEKQLSKVTVEDIDSLYNLKLDEGYSTSYIRKMHHILTLAFTQAVRWKKVMHNPAVSADPPSVRTKEVAIWSKEEIHLFLETCRKERLYIAFLLAIYTGMRRGEILGLKWNDIDFRSNSLQVNRTLSYVQGEGYLFTTPKTTRSKRKIPLSNLVIAELKEHRRNQEVQKKVTGEMYQDQDLVVCTGNGSAQDPRNLLRVTNRIIKQAGVRAIRFHDLRHTHASILLSEGVDLVKVSARMGHTSPKTTLEIYAHLVPNNDYDVADVFEMALKNPVTDL